MSDLPRIVNRVSTRWIVVIVGASAAAVFAAGWGIGVCGWNE